MNKSKTAFIAIVGCPNAGKSTILNRLLGQKVAIVSPKPQTTRTRIMGVLTENNVQLVFTDTPGYHRPRTKLGENMVKAVDNSIGDVDACLLVTEPKGELREAEKQLIRRFKKENIPAVLAINKIDTVPNKEELMSRILMFSQLYDFKAVVPVSAIDGNGMNELLDELMALSFESEHFFPDDTLTDQPEKVIAAEMIREKLLRLLDQEIPHGTAVAIEKFKERDSGDIIDIDATIYCEKESHKGIIIGKNGQMLKKVSTRARIDLEKFLGCKVNLKCWVKVKEDWRNREGLIHNFGLDTQ
ncbi:MAG: GTPase Era [Clostridiales bacterium]|nr:GTPase Era [Clostridiales bacterium]MCD7827056.1 GTPase Era [Clostridiales bacterium]